MDGNDGQIQSTPITSSPIKTGMVYVYNFFGGLSEFYAFVFTVFAAVLLWAGLEMCFKNLMTMNVIAFIGAIQAFLVVVQAFIIGHDHHNDDCDQQAQAVQAVNIINNQQTAPPPPPDPNAAPPPPPPPPVNVPQPTDPNAAGALQKG